jgi:threonine dehydratase
MLAQQPDIDCLCVAIGGGGLIRVWRRRRAR